jgi:hypothetical protein
VASGRALRSVSDFFRKRVSLCFPESVSVECQKN